MTQAPLISGFWVDLAKGRHWQEIGGWESGSHRAPNLAQPQVLEDSHSVGGDSSLLMLGLGCLEVSQWLS